MTLIIMLGLYFIVVTEVEQQLLPNRPGKRSYMAPILVRLSPKPKVHAPMSHSSCNLWCFPHLL